MVVAASAARGRVMRMLSFPLRQRAGRRTACGADSHPPRSSTACVQDAPLWVLRLADPRSRERRRAAYGCGSAPDFDRLSPTAGVGGVPPVGSALNVPPAPLPSSVAPRDGLSC